MNRAKMIVPSTRKIAASRTSRFQGIGLDESHAIACPALLGLGRPALDWAVVRVGILTGGGDCPGLNAVIRAVVRKGELAYGDELVGFLDAWDGVLERRTMALDVSS